MTASSSPDTEPRGPQPRRAATIFIFITIVLDIVAMGMVIPVMPQLIQQVAHVNAGQLAMIFGVFGTSWAVMQLISSPVQGALSDRFGRRPIILTSNFGMGVNYLLMAVAPSLGWLFAGRIVSGLCAGSIPAAMAYLADVNPPEKRAASFGILGAGFSLGIAVGPALGGLLGAFGPRAPFWAAAGLSLVNAMYGLFVLPESLPRERRAPLNFWRLNPVGALVSLIRSYPALGGMLAVSFLLTLAQQGPNNVFVIYCKERYRWGPADIGLMLSAMGVAGMIVQAGLISLVIKRIGERKALIVGGALQIASMVMFAVAATGAQFLMALPISALGAIGGPSWSAILSRTVDASEQGRLAGATSSLSSLSAIFGPLLFTSSFAVAEQTKQTTLLGAPFYLAAAVLTVAIALAAWVTRREPQVVVA